MSRIIKENTDKKHPRITRRTLVIIVLVIVAVAGLATLGVWWYTSIRREEAREVTESRQDDPGYIRHVAYLEDADRVAAELVAEAQPAADAGDVAKIERIYAEAIIEHEGRPHVQANLYLVMAHYMVTLKQDAKALAAAQKSYEVDTDKFYERVTLPLIGYTAYRLGQKELALEYLRKNYELQKDDPYLEAGALQETEEFLKRFEADL